VKTVVEVAKGGTRVVFHRGVGAKTAWSHPFETPYMLTIKGGKPDMLPCPVCEKRGRR
jgi:hypothetical protein